MTPGEPPHGRGEDHPLIEVLRLLAAGPPPAVPSDPERKSRR